MATYIKNSTWADTIPSRSDTLFSSLSSSEGFGRRSAVMASCVEREINAFLWLALIGVTAYLLRKLFKVFEVWAKAGPLPGPACGFYGHCHLIAGSNLTDVLHMCHEKYGGVVRLWLGPTQLLVSIEDKELIKDVLLKAEDKLPLTGRAFRLAFGRSSLFVSSFDKVEHKRKSVERKLGGTLLKRISLIPEKILDSIIERAQCAIAKGVVDCETISLHLAFTILGATIFGDALLTWPKAAEYEALLMEIAREACFWASYGVTPFWKKEFWKFKDSCTELKCLTEELIHESKQNCKSDFLQDFGGHDDMECELCGEVVSLIFHGSLTMGALIANVLTRLVTHTDIQDKFIVASMIFNRFLWCVNSDALMLYASIFNVINDYIAYCKGESCNRVVAVQKNVGPNNVKLEELIHSEVIMAPKVRTIADQQAVDVNWPILLATVYESARLLPAGPLLQRCSLKHDLTLKNGMVIPATSMIVVPVQLVQMDTSNWGIDAGKFNPHRFLSSTGAKCVSTHVTRDEHNSCTLRDPSEFEAFLPFGFGARACIGQKLAILGISSLFAALIGQYEVTLRIGSECNMKPAINNYMLQLRPSPKIVFVKRSTIVRKE
ncbi:cytochrome P450 [Striga asiatica]|uniref:Cytochrome P450 n=1 Tax=Striga asiatica TaxID=4170 RepID=A0A5A7PXJ3_STRAF|nr:cytochrome P450 [Striga asiatica]